MSPALPEAPQRVLMVGCGDLGARIAHRLTDAGDEVWTLNRSGLDPASGRSLRGDVAVASSLPPLSVTFSLIVYCIAPSSRDEAAYRRVFIDGVRNVLAWAGSASTRIVFVSSTAVYARGGSDWVDESSISAPEAFNGRVLLEAEAMVLDQADALVLRLGGIYGPGRDLLVRNVRAQVAVSATMLQWGNRIHVDDAAAAASHLIGIGASGIFNVVDRSPTPAIEVMDWIADQLLISRLKREDTGVATSGRRVDAGKLSATGFIWKHADFRSGYAASFESLKSSGF